MRRVAFACASLLSFSSPADAVSQCVAPPPPRIVSTPSASVAEGQTYGISWTESAGAGTYLIERSRSAGFDDTVESQRTSNRGASFVSFEPALWFHRVRAAADCNAALESAPSETSLVQVVAGPPMVIFTTGPVSAIVAPGSSPGVIERSVIVENLTKTPVTVDVITEAIDSPPFFHLTSVEGEKVTSLQLAPGSPRRLLVRFDGLDTSQPRGLQGLISLRGVDRELVSTPYAAVAVRVGAAGGGGGIPQFRVAGSPVNRVWLPPLRAGQPDENREPVRVEIFNPAATPMDLVAEIGPEAWLLPKSGWNDSPVPPQSSVVVELFSDRSRAPAAAAFPRYTWFAVRTATGAAARLLVEDREVSGSATVIFPPLLPGTRAFMIPGTVAIEGAARSRWATRVQLTNVSDEPLNLEFFFRSSIAPQSMEAAHTTIEIRPRDVVAIADLLRDHFFIERDFGFVEVRVDEQKARFLTITSETYGSGPAGETVARLPVFEDGEGATPGSNHVVPALWTAATRTNIALITMARNVFEPVLVQVTGFDSSGAELGSAQLALAPAAYFQTSAISFLNLPAGEESRLAGIRLSVESTNGSARVALLAMVIDNATAEFQSIHVGQSEAGKISATSTEPAGVSVSKAHVVLGAVHEPAGGTSHTGYSTQLRLTATGGRADVLLSYLTPGSASGPQPRITIDGGSSLEIPSIGSLFGVTGGREGTLLVHANANIQLAGQVIASPMNAPSYVAGELPILSDASEALASAQAGRRRPIYFDGLEQSTGGGKRWTLGLTEVSGRPAVVNVRLYEPANRAAPIAEQNLSLGGREHRLLDTIFSSMGLDSEERRKDRLNVQVVITPVSGSGVIAALATGYDVRTGDSTRYVLTPSGGVPATGVSKVSPVDLPPPQRLARRRAVSP